MHRIAAHESMAVLGLYGGSQNYGYPFGGPHNKDYNILGSTLGFPYLGKLPYRDPITGVMGIMVNKMETTRKNTMETTMIEKTKETAIMENRMETTTTMKNTIEIIVMENTIETTIMGLGQAAQDCCASSRTKSRQRVLTWLPCYRGRHDTQRLNHLLGIISTSAQGLVQGRMPATAQASSRECMARKTIACGVRKDYTRIRSIGNGRSQEPWSWINGLQTFAVLQPYHEDLKEPSSWEASHHPPPHARDPN